jgi:hypothetical protein
MAIALVAVVGLLAAGVAAVVGFGIGSLLTPAFALYGVGRVPQGMFRRVVAVLLIVLGLYMAIAIRG